LECELILSWDLAFITEAVMEEFVAAVVQVKRMLARLIGRLFVSARSKSRNSPRLPPLTGAVKRQFAETADRPRAGEK